MLHQERRVEAGGQALGDRLGQGKLGHHDVLDRRADRLEHRQLRAGDAAAVGNGVPFIFREGPVPAFANPVAANSQDLTYHSCVNFVDEDSFQERGYFWVSSFQDAVGVVDSQINDFQPNGYHIYARYGFAVRDDLFEAVLDDGRQLGHQQH